VGWVWGHAPSWWRLFPAGNHPGLSCLMAPLNFSRVLQYLSLQIVFFFFWWKKSQSRRHSQSQNTVAIVSFADGSILNYFLVGECSCFKVSFWLSGELLNPWLTSCNDDFHELFSLSLVTRKIFKRSNHIFAFVLQWAFSDPVNRHFRQV
jgi:hypothetical protein